MHTKEEWVVIDSGGRVMLKAVGEPQIICTLETVPLKITPEIEVRAKIIAAAPDMLEALKESRNRLVFFHNSIRGETKPIFEDIEIRKTGSCIMFLSEAIIKAENED